MSVTRLTFDHQIKELEQDLLRLGSVVEGMLERAMRALINQDVPLADHVVDEDDVADHLDLSIETKCMHLLALQQPMSKDLRTIGSILKAITDLERIGDFSVDIAKIAKNLADEPFYKPLPDIPRMAELSQAMVRNTLKAFVDRDLAAVHRICTDDDDAVDYLNHSLFDQLLQQMHDEPRLVVQSAYLILVVRCLERIADHCTNVGERIHYMETGILKEMA